jgi:LysM repeat protein
VRRWTLLLLAGALVLAAVRPVAAGEKPRVHTVYRGQRLGSIAKRYHVTVEAIAYANALPRKDLIVPGQKLIIPDRDDAGGKEARKLHDRGVLRDTERPKQDASRGKSRRRGPRLHTVYRGQRLGSIAKRYHVSIDAICTANGIRRQDPIRPRQLLVIPASDDPDGTRARQHREEYLKRHRSRVAKRVGETGRKSWAKYAKPPRKLGYVRLCGHDEAWSGYVIGPGNRVLGGARRAITRVFKGQRLPHGVSRRLIYLLAKVSDKFGGRTIRIVSGYRSVSYARESRHKTGHAVDFSIPGVPNSVLRDYLLTLPKVGVGYYPNSSFVHLDVRQHKTYWVDYSGPGEPPRYGKTVRMP